MKKALFTLLAGLLAMPVCAQSYNLSGNVPEGATVVYLRNVSHPNTPDSIVIAAGQKTFCFKGEAKDLPFAHIFTNRKTIDSVPVFLSGDVRVDIDAKKACGTPENCLLTKTEAKMAANKDEVASIETEVEELQNSGVILSREVLQPYIERYEAAQSRNVEIVKQLADSNLNSPVPAYYIADLINDLDRADIIRWADAGAEFMKAANMKGIASMIDMWRRGTPGAKFTDIEEDGLDGKPHKLSEYVGTGNYVLIDFWASWCGPCMRELPNVKAAYEKYHAKGFDIVGLSFDQDEKAWRGAIDRVGMPWHHMSDLKGWQTLASETYGINAIPATLLVSPDGTIIANGLRGEALQAKLKEIFGE